MTGRICFDLTLKDMVLERPLREGVEDDEDGSEEKGGSKEEAEDCFEKELFREPGGEIADKPRFISTQLTSLVGLLYYLSLNPILAVLLLVVCDVVC